MGWKANLLNKFGKIFKLLSFSFNDLLFRHDKDYDEEKVEQNKID